MRNYFDAITRHRTFVILATLLLTTFLGYRISGLKVVIDVNTVLPKAHEYVRASDDAEKTFGGAQVVVIALTPKTGDVFQPEVLAKVQRITEGVSQLPNAIKSNVLSLAAHKAKSVEGTSEGMVVRPLLESIPRTPEALAALRSHVRAMPVYSGSIISKDESTTAVLAQFKDPTGTSGFQGLLRQINEIVDRERDGSVDIALAGQPVFLSRLEIYSQRIAILFLVALLVTGLIHYEAFRTAQGLILPLLTALIAVVWGLGAMSLAGVPLDAFNSTTPILILAVAAGHAVQILKRYYEEYGRLIGEGAPPSAETNRAAVVTAAARIAPVMIVAGVVAALGFFSLLMFEISSIRTFGVFTGLGILSALVIEMTFIPALRASLSPPKQREREREHETRLWDRVAARLATWVLGPGRRGIYVASLLVLGIALVGMRLVRQDNDLKNYFAHGLDLQRDDRAVNEALGGSNSMYVLIEGKEADAMKDPQMLAAMEETQRFIEQQPGIGKTLSLADFVKRMNRAMNGDAPAFDRLPADRATISQYLLLYSLSGDPDDFDTYVDNDYRTANVWVLLKSNSTAAFEELVAKLKPFVQTHFGDRARIRFGGSLAKSAALNEVMIAGKIRNIVQVACVLLLLTALAFRSFLGGLLILVPLAFTAIVNFGLLGLARIPLNVSNAITTAMAVGIGADYAIYFIFRLREELATGTEEAAAVRKVFATAGKAVLFVASAVAGGYGVLVFSFGFYLHIWMGILIATAMVVSALSALTLLPSLILTIRPAFVFGVARKARPGAVAATGAAAMLLLSLLDARPAHAELSAREIMQKNFMVGKVVGSVQDASIELVTKDGQKRVRQTISLTKLEPNGIDNRRLVKFIAPEDVRGTATLLVEHAAGEDDIWIYLPALRKVRRLVASNKKDSFVGTDFSYADVIGHHVDDWNHRLVREETVDGQACFVIESLPKSDEVKTASGYAKRLSWIRKDNFVTVKGETWDGGGTPFKTTAFRDVRLVDPRAGRWQAMVAEAINQQTGHRSVVRFDHFKLDATLDDQQLTTRALETQR